MYLHGAPEEDKSRRPSWPGVSRPAVAREAALPAQVLVWLQGLRPWKLDRTPKPALSYHPAAALCTASDHLLE